jgi:outer membrane protein assembly factor BamB
MLMDEPLPSPSPEAVDQVEISDLDPQDVPLSPVARRIQHLLSPRTARGRRWSGPLLSCALALVLVCTLLAVVAWPWLPAQKPVPGAPLPSGKTGIAPSLSLIPAGPLVYVQAPDGDILAEQASDGHLLWHRGLGSSPDCTTGTHIFVCLATRRESTALQVLNAQDGHVLWSRQIAASQAAPALQVDQGLIYVSTRDGWLQVLRAADGTPLWSYRYARESARPLSEFLTLEQDIAVIRTPDGVSHLLRTSDGSELLHYISDGGLPRVDQGIIYLALGFHTSDETDGTLLALREADGQLLWRETVRASADWAPVEIAGTVYVGSPDGAILAFAGRDGTRTWVYRADQPVIGAPTGQQGRLYALLQDGGLVALRAADGRQLWRTQIAPFARFSSYTPQLAADQLFLSRFTSRGSIVYTVRASDGSIRWFHDVGSDDALHAPVVFHDIVYLLQNDGSLDAWRISDGAHVWRYTTPTNPIEQIRNEQRTGTGILYLLTFYNSLVVLHSSDGHLLWRLGPFAEP